MPSGDKFEAKPSEVATVASEFETLAGEVGAAFDELRDGLEPYPNWCGVNDSTAGQLRPGYESGLESLDGVRSALQMALIGIGRGLGYAATYVEGVQDGALDEMKRAQEATDELGGDSSGKY
jgi:hypothetical protein